MDAALLALELTALLLLALASRRLRFGAMPGALWLRTYFNAAAAAPVEEMEPQDVAYDIMIQRAQEIHRIRAG